MHVSLLEMTNKDWPNTVIVLNRPQAVFLYIYSVLATAHRLSRLNLINSASITGKIFSNKISGSKIYVDGVEC